MSWLVPRDGKLPTTAHNPIVGSHDREQLAMWRRFDMEILGGIVLGLTLGLIVAFMWH